MRGACAERRETQPVGVLLAPIQAALFAEDPQAEAVKLPHGNGTRPERADGAAGETQMQMGVVLEPPARTVAREQSGNVADLLAADEAGHMERMAASIGQARAGTDDGRVVAPARAGLVSSTGPAWPPCANSAWMTRRPPSSPAATIARIWRTKG